MCGAGRGISLFACIRKCYRYFLQRKNMFWLSNFAVHLKASLRILLRVTEDFTFRIMSDFVISPAARLKNL